MSTTVLEGTPAELADRIRAMPGREYRLEVTEKPEFEDEVRTYAGLDERLARRKNRTPEDQERMRQLALKIIIPGRPLPPGKTLDDMIGGSWPGDETDEEIFEALRRMS